MDTPARRRGPSGNSSPFRQARLSTSNLRNRSFRPLLRRAGLEHICLHDLRHTCATLLFERNVHPKLVQELLGRSTISVTLDTYSHFLPSMGDQTVRAMEAALGDAP